MSASSSPFFKHWLCGYVTFLPLPTLVERFPLANLDTSHQLLHSYIFLSQPCRYQWSPSAVCAVDSASVGAASWWMPLRKQGDWYRHIMHSACQLVRNTVCARALILSVWLTQPACPSISGFVSVSDCHRVYSVFTFCVYFLANTSPKW